jgi:PAS domain-containing protein
VFAEQGFLRADGSVCPMDLTTTLIPWDNKGNVILATLRDVTEQRRAEEALKPSEELLENTFKGVFLEGMYIDRDNTLRKFLIHHRL